MSTNSPFLLLTHVSLNIIFQIFFPIRLPHTTDENQWSSLCIYTHTHTHRERKTRMLNRHPTKPERKKIDTENDFSASFHVHFLRGCRCQHLNSLCFSSSSIRPSLFLRYPISSDSFSMCTSLVSTVSQSKSILMIRHHFGILSLLALFSIWSSSFVQHSISFFYWHTELVQIDSFIALWLSSFCSPFDSSSI